MSLDEWKNVIIVVVIAVTLAYVLTVATREGESAPVASIHDDDFEAMDRSALLQAYQQQMVSLFVVWMKDPTGQPERAAAGIARVRKAYINAATKIDERAVKPQPR